MRSSAIRMSSWCWLTTVSAAARSPAKLFGTQWYFEKTLRSLPLVPEIKVAGFECRAQPLVEQHWPHHVLRPVLAIQADVVISSYHEFELRVEITKHFERLFVCGDPADLGEISAVEDDIRLWQWLAEW